MKEQVTVITKMWLITWFVNWQCRMYVFL